MLITPLTELEAVNEILGSIGESPVNSLEDNVSVDVVNALRILKSTSRNIQSMGWTCNTFEDVEMIPDSETKRIRWSPLWITIKSSDKQYIKRGEYLFNKTDNTYKFNSTIKLTVIMFEDFEDIPDVLRNYITAKAVRQFQSRYLSAEELTQESRQNEAEAWKNLQEYEMEINNFNMLNNTDIQTSLNRGI
jgi:hypothetical protein